jgi:hypothetical protein
MSKLFSPPKQPKLEPAPLPAPLPPEPERSDAQTQELADEQRKRLATSGSGRSSTFLTGGGLTEASSSVRFLGGAART